MTGKDRVVIVGAGVGGLAAAIRLSAAGIPVTVLERASALGGKMRTVPSDAGPVDAGPTVLTLRDVFDDLFAAGGARLDDHVTLHPLPVLARHFWTDGAILDLHADPSANETALRAFGGPRAADEFQAFCRHARRLRRAFEAPMMRAALPRAGMIALSALARPQLWPALMSGRSLASDVARRFTDPRLRQLFGRYATYVGGSPGLSPAVLALIWDVERAGVWAVQGGMHALAQAMARLAEALGAEIRTATGVSRIDVDSGSVSAVVTDTGARLACSQVVFNGDPAALHAGLLGAGVGMAVPTGAVMPRSLSARVWAFAAKPEGLPLSYHNVLFADSEANEFDPLRRGRTPEAPTLYLCAQDRIAGDPAGPLERFEMILNAPPHPAQAPNSHAKDVEKCRQQTIQRLDRFGLTLRSMSAPTPLQAPALTLPQDFARLFPGSGGALYGLSPHGAMASLRRPGARSRVLGLYLAGGGTHPGAGVPMATLSGQHAAEAIMHDRALISRSAPMAMRGGMSTASAMTGPARSR